MGYDALHAFAFSCLFLCEHFASQLSLIMGIRILVRPLVCDDLTKRGHAQM